MIIIWTWIKANWQGLAAGLIAGFLIFRLTGNSSGTISATSNAGAHQAISGTATASSSAEIIIPGRAAAPCPPDKICPECPAVKIVYDCKAALSGGAVSSISATASVLVNSNPWGLDLGVGKIIQGGESWNVEAGLSYGKLRGAVGYATDGSVRVSGSYKIIGN